MSLQLPAHEIYTIKNNSEITRTILVSSEKLEGLIAQHSGMEMWSDHIINCHWFRGLHPRGSIFQPPRWNADDAGRLLDAVFREVETWGYRPPGSGREVRDVQLQTRQGNQTVRIVVDWDTNSIVTAFPRN